MMNTIAVWAPHYSSGSVYIKPYKILPGMNKVVFTKVKHLPLLMDSQRMRDYPMASHGKIGVYKIPIKDFAKEELINQMELI